MNFPRLRTMLYNASDQLIEISTSQGLLRMSNVLDASVLSCSGLARLKTENRPLTSIRGLAALWVFGLHLSLYQPTSVNPLGSVFSQGAVGVDVFFVLSGFILSSVYQGIQFAEFKGFIRKRFFRVYPLHLATTLTFGLLVGTAQLMRIPLAHDATHSWRAFPFAIAMLHPYVGQGGNWNGPSWSLAVEFPCYLTLPFLQHIICKLSRCPLTILLGILAASECVLLLNFGDTTNAPPALFRAILGFTLGITAERVSRLVTPNMCIVGTCEISISVVIILLIVIKQALFVPALCAGIFVLLSWDMGPISKLLRAKVPYWAGTVSFSIYLIQGPVIAVTRSATKLLLKNGYLCSNYCGASIFLVSSLSITLFVSQWAWKHVETPARALGRSSASARPQHRQ